jgi:serine/threonine protein phosphatase PrpC
MKQYVLDAAGLSDRGVKREHNEDAWSSPPADLTSKQLAAKGRLYLVADGVGGHQAGDVASTMAAQIIQERYYADPSDDMAGSLTAAIQAANEQIDASAAARPERRGMGTTVTAVALRENEMIVANVGDSRTYLIRAGQARQLTADHTWVEEQVQAGLITREQADRHPQRNIITRSLGGMPELQVDIFEEQVQWGDSLLLCSDGLSNMVSDQEIGALLSQGRQARATVNELIRLAKQRGAPDNVTAVVLNLLRPARGGGARLLLTAGILLGLGLIIGGLALRVMNPTATDENPISAQPTPKSGPVFSSSPLGDPTALPSTSPIRSPLPVSIPPLELVWPAEDISLVAGDTITFAWNWDAALEEEAGRFIFELQTSTNPQPILRQELPLGQRRYVVSHSLEPGRYLWTMSVSGVAGGEASAGRLFLLTTPTLTPTAATLPTPTSSN